MGTPGARLAAVLIIGLLAVIASVEVALLQPHFAATFQEGDVLESSLGKITLDALDFVPEPGEISLQEEFTRFHLRQDEIVKVTSIPFTLTRGEEVTPQSSQRQSFSNLSFLFWVQVFVGWAALSMAGCIWALRPRDVASTLFALSGAATCVAALPSAIYTTRSLAIPTSVFFPLEVLNILGSGFFGICVIGLFLVYPIRLPKWRLISILQAIFFTTWMVLSILELIPIWANTNLLIVVAMLSILIAVGCQYFATRKDPKARASLAWLGLSMILGAGAFVVFNTVPLLLRITPMNQGYAFTFFLIIYLGIAAGLTQYRLFEVGQWAFRLFFYAVGTVFFVILDVALVYFLDMDRLPALGFALLAIGFVYLPLRDYLWRRFSKRNRLESHEMLAEALYVAFAPSSKQREARWSELLTKMFSPLEMEPATDSVGAVSLSQDGLTMLLPAVASAPALRLSYPWSGSSLFNRDAQSLAQQLVRFIRQAESNREAYDRGVNEERRRMAQDLHDDVGARLLTGLYEADEKLRPTLQGALSDIRSIVSGMTGEKLSLGRMWADLRYETAQRLSAASIEMTWPLMEEAQEELILDYHQHKAISSAIREIISNAIRHSSAKSVQVFLKVTDGAIKIEILDNGRGISLNPQGDSNGGHGMQGLKRRLSEVGGQFLIQSIPGRTQIFLTIPIEVIYP